MIDVMTNFFAETGSRHIYRVGALCAVVLCLGSPAQTASVPIPNFAPDNLTSWYPDRQDGDNFLPPESGPGPILSPKDHPYIPNAGFVTDRPELRKNSFGEKRAGILPARTPPIASPI
jgi:hypothetical protein